MAYETLFWTSPSVSNWWRNHMRCCAKDNGLSGRGAEGGWSVGVDFTSKRELCALLDPYLALSSQLSAVSSKPRRPSLFGLPLKLGARSLKLFPRGRPGGSVEAVE